MANIKQVLHRKNSSGSYDIIYLQADMSNVTGTLSVSNGGTGRATLTSKAILAGNGTSAVSMISVASGALYSTGTSTAAKFGTLPVAQGGTGNTSVDTTPTSGSTKMCTSGGIYTAIDTLKTSVSEGKASIASAITDKGVSTSSTASFATMSSNIRAISTAPPYVFIALMQNNWTTVWVWDNTTSQQNALIKYDSPGNGIYIKVNRSNTIYIKIQCAFSPPTNSGIYLNGTLIANPYPDPVIPSALASFALSNYPYTTYELYRPDESRVNITAS